MEGERQWSSIPFPTCPLPASCSVEGGARGREMAALQLPLPTHPPAAGGRRGLEQGAFAPTSPAACGSALPPTAYQGMVGKRKEPCKAVEGSAEEASLVVYLSSTAPHNTVEAGAASKVTCPQGR